MSANGDVSSISAAVVSDALLEELNGPFTEQDSVFTDVLNLQTQLSEQAEKLHAKLNSIPATASTENNAEMAKYMQKLALCRSKLHTLNAKLGLIEKKVDTTEQLLVEE